MDPATKRALGKYTSLAFLLPISTGVGYLMGYGLDHLFHTSWLRWVFMVLGTVSGFMSLIKELDAEK